MANKGTIEDRAILAERGNDLYETHPVAVRALLEVECLPPVIWEPACGPGAIVRVLREMGHTVHATDLVNYMTPDQDHYGRDFLMELQAPPDVQAIVTNPPFKLATEFVEHALTLCPEVFMLLRLGFMEGMGRTRLLEKSGLRRVHLFRNRLPRMHRDGWTGNKASSRMAFAWFCWRRGYVGPVTIDRITWRHHESHASTKAAEGR